MSEKEVMKILRAQKNQAIGQAGEQDDYDLLDEIFDDGGIVSMQEGFFVVQVDKESSNVTILRVQEPAQQGDSGSQQGDEGEQGDPQADNIEDPFEDNESEQEQGQDGESDSNADQEEQKPEDGDQGDDQGDDQDRRQAHPVPVVQGLGDHTCRHRTDWGELASEQSQTSTDGNEIS